MYWNALYNIHSLHLKFITDFSSQCQFDSNKAVSAIPSYIFLIFAFILVHQVINRRTNPLTRFKLRLYREVGFQWMYFYIARIWFLCIKIVNWINKLTEGYLEAQHLETKLLWLNHLHVKASLLAVLTCIAMVPFSIVILNCFWKHSMPNFLIWVGEDPWVRSEIGISGHYLDRPPNFALPKRREYAYRSRRSISVEHTVPIRKQPIRFCKSLIITNCSNTLQTMI